MPIFSSWLPVSRGAARAVDATANERFNPVQAENAEVCFTSSACRRWKGRAVGKMIGVSHSYVILELLLATSQPLNLTEKTKVAACLVQILANLSHQGQSRRLKRQQFGIV